MYFFLDSRKPKHRQAESLNEMQDALGPRKSRFLMVGITMSSSSFRSSVGAGAGAAEESAVAGKIPEREVAGSSRYEMESWKERHLKRLEWRHVTRQVSEKRCLM